MRRNVAVFRPRTKAARKQEGMMRKFTIIFGAGFAAGVAIAAATALGGNTSPEVRQVSDPAKKVVERMSSIEHMTMEAGDLPVQYYHPI